MAGESEKALVLHAAEVVALERGGGITTKPLVGRWNTADAHLTSGVTTFLPGTMIAPHSHNTDEVVLILEGDAVAYIGDERHALTTGDVTWTPRNVTHHFVNETDAVMRIYWVYAGREITRTLAETGETFEHLSPEDCGIGSSTAQ